MRVRVCCLASAWLAPLGRRFREAEMSVADSRSLFPRVQMNKLPFYYLDLQWVDTNDAASLSCRDREGTLALILPRCFSLMEYKQTCQSSPSYTWSCDPRGRNTVETNLFHRQRKGSPQLCFKNNKTKTDTHTHTHTKKSKSVFSEARCQTQSSDHELTLPQLTDKGFSQWKTVAATAWACLFLHHSTI